MQDIENEVRGIIAQIIERDPNDITLEARFFEDLGVDSMMALEILVAIEKKYKIKIPEEKLPELRTLGKAVEIARQYLEKKDGAAA
jgi:acyl carrier protein